ncbi:hypothetical protein KACC15558_00650 [Brevibacterium ammoniilyticum]|uniref:Uncharacterized protein n=1 Tax=Brevibacterium ammoniilyticum TaxID=1046555 RepID=A0ABP9TVC8_9MICO
MFGLPTATVVVIFGIPTIWVIYTFVFVFLSRHWSAEDIDDAGTTSASKRGFGDAGNEGDFGAEAGERA